MVGRVLRSHGLAEKKGSEYFLCLDQKLTKEETIQLVELCHAKLTEYQTKRGEQIWQHRKLSSGYISGTLRFEVLKKAQFHCELCGISADIRALEVDHIVPRNLGGTDDPTNLQALCYSCNSMKRDKDETDFRMVRQSFKRPVDGCLFCKVSAERVLHENELAFAIRDEFPVTRLHTLIIPKRHVLEAFDLSRPEVNACNELSKIAKQFIEHDDFGVSGFNVGFNDGEVAGQTVPPKPIGDPPGKHPSENLTFGSSFSLGFNQVYLSLNHSSLRGVNPSSRFAFELEAPLSFVW
jgi:ATP adenylyltransferase